MRGEKKAGIDLESLPGTALWRSVRSGVVGLSQTVATSIVAVANPPVFIYFNIWSDADRKAFWTGFTDRGGEFGEELKGYYDWFHAAFGFGDTKAFDEAWSDFGSTLMQLTELAWKMTVAAGVPPPLALHPRRAAYARELAELGLAITRQTYTDYEKVYHAGGLPQCTGRLLADVLRLVFEVIATKGAAKATTVLSSSKLINRLPRLQKVPRKLAQPPSRDELVRYIKHEAPAPGKAGTSLHGEGILCDLMPGRDFVIRVEARSPKNPRAPGNWFQGPFRSEAEAKRFVQYLEGLGRTGIRQDAALPRVWFDGAQGNPIEVARIYRIKQPTPAISSVVAPQREGGTVMVRPEHRKAAQAGDIMKSAEYVGQGQQLSLPVTRAWDLHQLQLIEAVSEFAITKP